MNVTDVISSARDAITVERVYGEPYEKDGLTVIPVATVGGGAGGGSGHDEKGQEGEGGGFGLSGRPVGAYVIDVTDPPQPELLMAVAGVPGVTRDPPEWDPEYWVRMINYAATLQKTGTADRAAALSTWASVPIAATWSITMARR